MDSHKCEWKRSPEKEEGILVGCDEQQEWMLQWWWERYSEENHFPVTFIDYGMSQQAREWCRQRGELVPVYVDMSFVKPKGEIDLNSDQKRWECWYGDALWTSRPFWFKKPFACLHSPYRKTLWIDIDCEILGPIGDLFTYTSGKELALVREFESQHILRLEDRVQFNGGVIVFPHGAEIICKWAEDSILRNDMLLGDDKVLSALIFEMQWPVIDLPEVYNWKFIWGLNEHAIIYHWFTSGKQYIKNHGGIKPALQAFYNELRGMNS